MATEEQLKTYGPLADLRVIEMGVLLAGPFLWSTFRRLWC